uniref:Uncharacterized protein n=1 Tax=Physcomitrium patens TaxID=3218 RepID=A0A2K1IP28_PHYPA|nr:hypothetical protein PHYPA_027346 [Physcomitrium patens]
MLSCNPELDTSHWKERFCPGALKTNHNSSAQGKSSRLQPTQEVLQRGRALVVSVFSSAGNANQVNTVHTMGDIIFAEPSLLFTTKCSH